MMATVTVNRVQAPAALYCHYSGQISLQGCYVELDLRDGALSADYNAAIGNSYPMAQHLGHLRRWSIPCLTAEVANQLLDTIAPLAQTMCDGYESEWDGHNHVARLSDDAINAEHEIETTINESGYSDEDCVQYADAADWLYDIRDDLVTRLQTGETVAALEAELDGDGADPSSPILEGLTRYLEGLRDFDQVY